MLRECLELREKYVYREETAPWMKIIEGDINVPHVNSDPFHFVPVEATSVSFLLSCINKWLIFASYFLYHRCQLEKKVLFTKQFVQFWFLLLNEGFYLRSNLFNIDFNFTSSTILGWKMELYTFMPVKLVSILKDIWLNDLIYIIYSISCVLTHSWLHKNLQTIYWN